MGRYRTPPRRASAAPEPSPGPPGRFSFESGDAKGADVFTGIIQAVGALGRREPRGSGHRLHVRAPFAALEPGESVAVDGACLTVAQPETGGFAADVSLETERRTTLGQLRPGARVNLERALAVGERLGGHFVSGHVDGVCQIESVRALGGDRLVRVRAERELMPLIAVKGSVSLDGVSLTVNAIHGDGFDLLLIPHTLAATTLSLLAPGQTRNLEVDVLARYVARVLGRA